MKKIIIATDLSENSAHAAYYGYALAQQVKADVVLCHAMAVQAEVPQTGFTVWPSGEYSLMMDDSNHELEILKDRLYRSKKHGPYTPHISCNVEAGLVTDVINDIAGEYRADLIITGAHSSSFIADLVMGNHVKKLTDAMSRPMIVVPPGYNVKKTEHITLAVDLTQPDQDKAALAQVVTLAELLDASVTLVHVGLGANRDSVSPATVYELLHELAQQSNYQKIDTSIICADKIEDGLNELCGDKQTHLLVMNHRIRSSFESIIHSSNTKKMAGHTTVPLMILHVEQ